ncbi:FecR family protein [Spirosoma linguale]|uniref:Anti-FecI sigma factor, FecR n=1 Tax=Spirosoma linguale (strain ATCC 33905 / DSM 74 / LMG 10896 / Claus 1) TaxID=504472 RepID=D2QQH8_SPILD|nr:anti-FecI sigma factor, FecR [Spirosoma linguale DSM 74]
MSRKTFRQLLEKYLRGECTPQEKRFVEHWYGLLETETGESGEELDMDELEGRLWNQIQKKMDTGEEPEQGRIVPLKRVRYRWLGIAASLLLIGGWFYFSQPIRNLLPGQALSVEEQTGWLDRSNTSSRPMTVRLEDGSVVQLSAKSSLRFPKHFAADKRAVYLTGDAFFSIQKMPARPFYVHTGEVVTKVLGTSFFVRTQAESGKVRVEVVTGRVTVYKQESEKQTSANGVFLTPNQAATFFADEQHFVTGLVDAPKVIQPAEAEKKTISLAFDDTPLADVLAQLERAYGIAIELENDQQKNCPLTANLTDQPLYTQLDIICAALKSTYKIQGTTILISGKSCTE